MPAAIAATRRSGVYELGAVVVMTGAGAMGTMTGDGDGVGIGAGVGATGGVVGAGGVACARRTFCAMGRKEDPANMFSPFQVRKSNVK